MSKIGARLAKLDVHWSPRAQSSLDETMAHIDAQDVFTGRLILKRLHTALDLISTQPDIGTRINKRHARRFAIPKTGHTIDYLVQSNEILVIRWVRQRQKF
jgi:plasmid stabilization system protein ParE